MLWEDLHRISHFIIYFNVVVWLLRIATPEIESKIWIGKSMSERRFFFYLIKFLTRLKWVLMQEHNKLYCTFWKQGCIWYIFFDLMQIVTRTQLLLSINTQILDNCSNKQKDNSMNKDDNKNKKKTPFSENSSFQEIDFFFLWIKKIKSQLSKVALNIKQMQRNVWTWPHVHSSIKMLKIFIFISLLKENFNQKCVQRYLNLCLFRYLMTKGCY